jgi:outer membrane protein TolC
VKTSIAVLFCVANAVAQDLPSVQDNVPTVQLAIAELRKAEATAGETTFWRRLLPRIQLSATLGTRDLLFSESGTLVLPTDSYRMTISLSLSELLDGTPHDVALLNVEEARLKVGQARQKQLLDSLHGEANRLDLADQIKFLNQEEGRLAMIVDYYEMLFAQGKVDRLPVERTRIELDRARNECTKAVRQSRLFEATK